MTDTHQVLIEETPGGDQPLPKAEGHVFGFQTQVAEAEAYVGLAGDRTARLRVEYETRLADALANEQRAAEALAALHGELEAAQAALPAAREAQAAYDALPQDEKDRLAAQASLARLRTEAEAAQAALAAAEGAANGVE
jgi:hypothetical protein